MSCHKNKKCGIWMIVIIPVIVSLHSFAFMYLWNLLVTDIFSLRFINFWESLGLIAIVKLLFMIGYRGSKGSCSIQNDKDDNYASFKVRMRDHFASKYCCTKEEDGKSEVS